MRRDLWLGLIGVVVLAGCDKPKIQSADEAPVTEAPAEATPPPVVAQATPESALPAPVGVGPKVDDEVYLVRRMSIPIDGGMRGFREGAKVKVVAVEGGKLTVTGNDVQFDVQVVDVSVTPPAAPAPRPAVTGAPAGGAPKTATAATELEKKKEINRITAQLSNLEIAMNNGKATISQTEAKITRAQAAMQKGTGNSPESRARAAELQRLMDLIRKQKKDLADLKREIYKTQMELSKVSD